MHFHYCHSNPKNPIGFVGRGWGGVWICHVEFSHRDFTFVHVQSQWIPDNMEDMNNVNIELASVYSPEFRIEGSRKYIFLWWTAFIFIIFIFFIFIFFYGRQFTQYEKTSSYKNCADHLDKLWRILCHLKKKKNLKSWSTIFHVLQRLSCIKEEARSFMVTLESQRKPQRGRLSP